VKEITMDQREISVGDAFREGEVWQSPKGTLYRVMIVKCGQAILKIGSDGSGRIVRRPWDAVIGWSMSKEHNHG